MFYFWDSNKHLYMYKIKKVRDKGRNEKEYD